MNTMVIMSRGVDVEWWVIGEGKREPSSHLPCIGGGSVPFVLPHCVSNSAVGRAEQQPFTD